MPRQFKGVIDLDIRKSKPDWEAFLDKQAPKDAPNVLVILYDDTGQAAWSPYGGRINMPTMDRLAKDGLTYTQWHTTSVCSPTRSCCLTGRNHHQNGFGTIAESAAGFPGYAGHIPPENATIATIHRNAGWSTFWVGKNHNVPVDAFDIGAANRKSWPLGLGYDRFYGFIGGETNQWFPELIEDNHFVEQPYQPDAAISWLGLRDSTGTYIDGEKSYRLTVPLPVPGKLFWSVTVYNAATRSQIQTDQNKAALRSLQELKNLGVGPSVNLYFGPTTPAGEESRWIETAPGRGCFVYFRIYGPEAAAFDGSWRPGDFEQQ